MGMSQRRFINSVSVGLPSQRQPPGPNSTARIVVSRGAKSDILIRIAIRHRKNLLYPFVEPLRERCQIFGGVEFGILKLPWLRVERSVYERNV